MGEFSFITPMTESTTIILIGAGHVNLYIAAHAETLIERGARVLLIAPGGFWYSGMATGLQAQSLVHACELPTQYEDGLLVTTNLQSVEASRIFAGGDCAAMEGYALPKLGVFGVRQAAFIHTNLLASLEGRPLVQYKPQKNYLAILNLGDKTALATWSRFWWNGRSSMKLKDFIDQRFIKIYKQFKDKK